MADKMGRDTPFILLDDARAEGAAHAQLFTAPSAVFTARRAEDVSRTLREAEDARRASGGHLAGYIAYEAGLAIEPKLCPLANSRQGANGPLVWLGLFDGAEEMDGDAVGAWLENTGGGAGAAPSIGPLEPQISFAQYSQNFARMMEAIAAGDIYQANLTLPLSGAYSGDPVTLYAQLRASAKAPYGALIFDGSHYLLSFSPELFVSMRGDAIKTKPMKGTRPRGADDTEDAALIHDLAQSEKDRAENLMIVDLLRNDLSRIASPSSVKVTDPFTVETYPSVHQMVTTVNAQMDAGKDAVDLLRAIFPCGSITGAPKIRAMEFIHEIERDARGPYCGAIGRIDSEGNAAFNVAIRTMRLTPIENDRGKAVLGIGSAIVADSNAEEEWRECQIKGGFVRQSSANNQAAQFDLIETMRFDPAEGIALLEFHLERMKASAAELGFSFDRHAARNQIQALCFELEKGAKLRLLLARSGAISLCVEDLPESVDLMKAIALPHPLDPHDWRLVHKSTDRGFHAAAHAAAKAYGAQEAVLVRQDGLITEGSWNSLFIERDGILLTPEIGLGLLPGVLRRHLLESGQAKEARLTLDDLEGGFFLGNALRGLMPAQITPIA